MFMKNIVLLSTFCTVVTHAADQTRSSSPQPIKVMVISIDKSAFQIQIESMHQHYTPHEIRNALSSLCNTKQGVLCINDTKNGLCDVSKIKNLKLYQINHKDLWFLAQPLGPGPYNDYRSKVDYICD
jgi:hypothetical protein